MATPPAVLLLLLRASLLCLLSSPASAKGAVVSELLKYEKIPLPSVTGPESLAFDAAGAGPYTGVSDGRVLKWSGPSRGWTEFSVPSPSRDRGRCDGSTDATLEDVCGRPLGLRFHGASGDLYVADAYLGLLVVGAGGGAATRVAAEAEGVPFALTNGVDVDQETGAVYFTDSSTRFQRREYFMAVATNDATGRFMKYDPRSKRVTVLARGLQFPNGVALSAGGDFAAVAETTRRRILRCWLRGPRAGAVEVMAEVPGYPDNVKRNRRGEFWVGVNSGWGGGAGDPAANVIAVRLDRSGRRLEALDDRSTADPVSEVEENNGTLWLGSVDRPFVGIFTR